MKFTKNFGIRYGLLSNAVPSKMKKDKQPWVPRSSQGLVNTWTPETVWMLEVWNPRFSSLLPSIVDISPSNLPFQMGFNQVRNILKER